MEALQYRIAPRDWTPDDPNPFSEDGAYGPEWSGFIVLAECDIHHRYGRTESGLYRFCHCTTCDGLDAHLADFLRYESGHGRTVIVSVPAGVDGEVLIHRALEETPVGPAIRETDPRWVSHSTPRLSWAAIQECGELRALSRLRREGWDGPGGLGFDEFGEPDDYLDYVALNGIEGAAGEHVVASHGRGHVVHDENEPFEPGMKLYFDGHAIIRDGLAVRDGLHLLKVRDRLPLDPYLVAAIGVEDLDPDHQVDVWTPRLFQDRARALFRERADGWA